MIAKPDALSMPLRDGMRFFSGCSYWTHFGVLISNASAESAHSVTAIAVDDELNATSKCNYVGSRSF